MVLTLEVIGEQAGNLGAAARKVFDRIGGTIGRLPDNDWVFADRYVSNRHALIRYVTGKYFIEDTSTNGVFINSPANRLSRTDGHQLRDGDVIYIDAYQIRVSIAAPQSADRDDPLALFGRDATRALPRRPTPQPDADRTASLVSADEIDDIEEIDELEDGRDEGTQWFGLGELPEALKQATDGARAQPAAAAAPKSAQRSARAADPRGAGASPLESLFAAAGIKDLTPSHDVAATLGDVLRVAVGGVMDVLRSRERMKDDLRLRGTSFKPADNNPLKFSANVDDAFHNLLVKHNDAYLAPAEAVEDALHDVRDHQAAMLTAMRIAFEAMCARFDPERLQEDFDRQMKKGSILGVPGKLRYWDLYREKYGALTGDAEAGFRALFADEFARAYEEQLERLRAQRTGQ
jgi:type VI secretion system FHA domain protein